MSAGPRHARNEAEANRIIGVRKHNRNGASCLLQGSDHWRTSPKMTSGFRHTVTADARLLRALATSLMLTQTLGGTMSGSGTKLPI
jgi:hypothetical protein